MKYYDKMILIIKWFMILSLVIMVILGATVLKHHADARNDGEINDKELGKIHVVTENFLKE
ncbi:MAG: hypothetical protein IK109_09915 [Clostridiales bacterium]|nr:hypothetical protein [Clostridiales bacterium]